MARVVEAATTDEALTLVPVDKYRRLTGDTQSFTADVEVALTEATRLVEEYLCRKLALNTHTETLPVRNGRVWVSHTPLVAAPEFTTYGNAVLVSPTYWSTDLASAVTVTYSGGYDSDTVPATIALEIVKTAQNLLGSAGAATSSTKPEGVSSIGLGDVRITYSDAEASSTGALASSSRRSLKPWKRVDL